jgi:hypothetical protein
MKYNYGHIFLSAAGNSCGLSFFLCHNFINELVNDLPGVGGVYAWHDVGGRSFKKRWHMELLEEYRQH